MKREEATARAAVHLLVLGLFLGFAAHARADVYLGATIGGETYGESLNAPLNQSAWDLFERHAGKPVAVLNQNQEWADFDHTSMNATHARGVIPLVSMGLAEGVTLADIAAGKQDTAIREWAREAKSWAHPFFFDPWWEMNGGWFAWGRDPSFVAAWRHFHDLVVAEGATNVTWTWVPNNIWSDPASDPLPYYPGDAYVDWVGIDGYNWGLNPAQPDRWLTPDQVLTPTLDRLGEIAPGKPVMLAETASSNIGGNKADWIREMLDTYLPDHPRIGACLWFNWSDEKGAGVEDWPIESSAPAQQAYRGAVRSSFFRAAPTPLPDLAKVPVPQAPAGAGESQPADLSPSGAGASSPRLAVAADGTSTVVWSAEDGSGHAIYERRIAADGSRAGPAVPLSDPGRDAFEPAVAIAPDGTATVVWTASDGTSFVIQTRQVGPGGDLGPVEDLSVAGQNALEPQVAVGGDGTAVAVWKRFDGSDYLIKARRISPAGGPDPTPSLTLSKSGQTAVEPRVAVSADGGATVVWSRYDGSDSVIQESRVASDDSASAPVGLSQAGQSAIEPALAGGADGGTFAVWARSDGSHFIVQGRRIAEDGSPGPEAVDLSASGGDALEPDASVGPDGSAIVVWDRSDGSDYIVQERRMDAAGRPGDPAEDLSALGGDAIEPRVAVGRDGAAAVAWSRLGGGRWLVERRGISPSGAPQAGSHGLSSPGRDAGQPDIGLAGDGRLLAVWRRFDGAHDLIQAASIAPPGVAVEESSRRDQFAVDSAFRVGKPILNRRSGSAILPVIVPGPGSVGLAGHPAGALVAAGPETVRLLVRPRRGQLRRLKEKGRANRTVIVVYSPLGGVRNSRRVTIGLRWVRRAAGRTAKPRA